MRFLISDKSEQVESKLEKIIGIYKHAGKWSIFLPADTIVGGILGFKTSFLTLDRGTKIFANSSSSSSNPSKMALLFTKELLPIKNKKTNQFKINDLRNYESIVKLSKSQEI